LRVAFASTLCLVLAEWCGLANSNLAVWTSYLVMAQYQFSIFQKGFERIVGRGAGILAGLLLATWFRNTEPVALVLAAVVLTVCFYIYFAGRLAYTFLNAGLFCMVIEHLGHADPLGALQISKELFVAIVFGVVVADVVAWATRMEFTLHIDVGSAPLWPLRADWVNRSLMLTVTALLTRTATTWLDLPPLPSVISVLMLSITPDVQAALRKGQLRLLGAFLATGWSLATYIIINQSPHFALLVVSLFLGIFVAAYLTRVGETYSYAGLQMGLVLPLVLVVPLPEFGSLIGVIQRLEGILAAMTSTVVVGSLWPNFPLRTDPAPAAGGTAQR
jgi:uncharacterized membrane protein YccC